MSDGTDWLLRPVLAGLCRYESLLSDELDLVDLAIMNELLDVRDENERRLRRAMERDLDR
jgi:hypothetical protein